MKNCRGNKRWYSGKRGGLRAVCLGLVLALVLSVQAPASDGVSLLDMFSLSDLSSLAEVLGGGSSGSGSSSSSSSSASKEEGLFGLLELLSNASKTKMTDCKVEPVEDQKYTGKEIRPSVKVTDGNKTLKRGTDYTLSYSDNIKVGTARITITGKGDYTGTKRTSFHIVKSTPAGGKSSSSGRKNSSSSKSGSSKKSSSKSTDAEKKSFTLKLGAESYVYNGKARKPSVTVTVRGKTVPKASYTVSYKDNTKVGKATVTVKGKGEYKNYSAEKTFKITLKKTVLSSVSSPAAGQIKAGWTKDSQAEGYQIQCCTNKTFTGSVKSVKVEGGTKQSALAEGLTAGKKYYVRIRSCKKVGSTNWYSEWSAAKTVTVKK